jgi:hypothetical protein
MSFSEAETIVKTIELNCRVRPIIPFLEVVRQPVST